MSNGTPVPSREAWLSISGKARLRGAQGQGASGEAALGLVADAFREHTDAFPRYLDGEFALALHDSERKTWWLARDAVGVEPLFYRIVSDRVLVSTEIGELVDEDHPLDEEYLARALVGDFSSQRLTPYQGVSRVPPGNIVTVTSDMHQRSRSWWETPAIDAGLSAASEAELADELSRLVIQAIQWAAHPPEAPVGCELTGGIDSSTVASVVGHLRVDQPRRAHTYTFSIRHDAAHVALEQPFIDAVVNRYGLPHRITGVLGRGDLAAFAPRGVMPHPTQLRQFRLEHLHSVTEDGIDVLLSGWGGDQLATFHGTGQLAGLLGAGNVSQAYQALRDRAQYLGTSRRALARQSFEQHVRAPKRVQQAIERVAAMAEPSFAARTGLAHLSIPPIANSADGERRRLFDDGHIQRRIECYGWDVSGLDLDYRYPLLDRRLVEWVLSVPADRWISGGEHRSLFRRAMADVVPQTVLARKRKNERDPNRRRLIADTQRDQEAMIAELQADPLVQRYLPGLSVQTYRQLDNPRRTHVLLVAQFLRHRTWQPDVAVLGV